MVETERPTELDIPAIARDLAGGAPFERIEPWLTASAADPKAFYEALAAYVAGTAAAAPKSRPFESYDLYHDLIARNLRRGRSAIVYEEPGAGWRRLSYDELHLRASILAAAWAAAGAKAGETVAVVLPIGGDAAVAFAAALRMGLVISFLPPRGAAFVQNRLRALEPERIATHSRYSSLFTGFEARVLPSAPEGSTSASEGSRSHTHGTGEPAVRLFSPLSSEPELPVERTADAIYLPLLRDATLVLGIQADDRVAIPGFDAVQFQPFILWATFFAGACFVEVGEDALRDPELVSKLGLKLIGVTPRLRDRILSGESSSEGWRSWFANLGEPYEWERWQSFAVALAKQSCRGFNLLPNAAFGGALLFSPRSLQPPHLSVLPAPGQPWLLADLSGSGEPAAGDGGMYAVAEEGTGEDLFGRFVLNRTRHGYFFAGSIDVGRRGQIYSEREVLEVVEKHPAVDAASVVVTPAAELLNKTVVTLLVFIDPRSDAAGMGPGLGRELSRRIENELGAPALPDRVKVYPLAPRRDAGGNVDHTWCRWQLASGMLEKKSRDPIFRIAGRLRRIAERVPTAEAAPAAE